MQLWLVEMFDGDDLMAIGLGREHAVGVDQSTVDQHCGRAGLAGVGAVANTDQAVASKHHHERVEGLAFKRRGGAVECDIDVHAPTSWTARAVSVAARCSR